MVVLSEYPFNHHPCYSDNRASLWHRIHLPVALSCNVKCAFCSHSYGSSCHTSKPGYSGKIMSPIEAIAIARTEINRNESLKIVAISGPGEPLANPETFETLQMIRDEFSDIEICLSTNGSLLEENVDWLRNIGVRTVSVSMSTATPSSASKIYEWINLEGDLLQGECLGSVIIESQLRGIAKASSQGINVKVNTILIPEINKLDIAILAREISKAGAVLQNIVPLIPNDKLASSRRPTLNELSQARQTASVYIKQFSHCKQCRSDVVGIPGNDRIL